MGKTVSYHAPRRRREPDYSMGGLHRGAGVSRSLGVLGAGVDDAIAALVHDTRTPLASSAPSLSSPRSRVGDIEAE